MYSIFVKNWGRVNNETLLAHKAFSRKSSREQKKVTKVPQEVGSFVERYVHSKEACPIDLQSVNFTLSPKLISIKIEVGWAQEGGKGKKYFNQNIRISPKITVNTPFLQGLLIIYMRNSHIA